MIADEGDEELESQISPDKVAEFGTLLKDALQNVWEDDAGDVFDAGCVRLLALNFIGN